MNATTTDPLDALREEFGAGWHIWRSQRDGEPAAWYASLRHPAFGVWPTVGADTDERLRAALIDQRKRADRGDKTPNVSAGTFHFDDGA